MSDGLPGDDVTEKATEAAGRAMTDLLVRAISNATVLFRELDDEGDLHYMEMLQDVEEPLHEAAKLIGVDVGKYT